MKPFNLEEAKVGKPVCTRNGRRVEIISFENPSNNNYPILAKVFFGKDDYEEFTFTESGTFFVADKESEADLMMTEDETEIPSLWMQSCTEENTKINYIIKTNRKHGNENNRETSIALRSKKEKAVPGFYHGLYVGWIWALLHR